MNFTEHVSLLSLPYPCRLPFPHDANSVNPHQINGFQCEWELGLSLHLLSTGLSVVYAVVHFLSLFPFFCLSVSTLFVCLSASLSFSSSLCVFLCECPSVSACLSAALSVCLFHTLLNRCSQPLLFFFHPCLSARGDYITVCVCVCVCVCRCTRVCMRVCV